MEAIRTAGKIHRASLALILIGSYPMCRGIGAEKPQDFDFRDFLSTAKIALHDSASQHGTVIRLTPSRQWTVGSAWYVERLRIRYGFRTTFKFQITERGGLGPGADGIAFVLQNLGPAATGGPGGAGGFSKVGPDPDMPASVNSHNRTIPHSVAIFFDTYRNTNAGDPSDNFIQICTTGTVAETNWPPSRLAVSPQLNVVLKDGNIHKASIVYEPPILSVFIDNDTRPAVKSIVDLSTVVGPDGSAYAGLTASTGAGWENHDIVDWAFSNTGFTADSTISYAESTISYAHNSCLPGKNLCTPKAAVIEPTSTGYHVVLPANLKWGVKIPTPDGKVTVVKNAEGHVCWDLKLTDMGCNGPLGNGLKAGPTFLSPETQAGGIARRVTLGATFFSINGRSNSDFRDHEGYFEFDVEFQ